MRLLYGTYNPAKLATMRRHLTGTGIELAGLAELACPPPEVDETGRTPLENARIKAMAYRDATGMTTLSADSGLYLDGVSEQAQPGEHARRVEGSRLTDEQMIAHYAGLARGMGGRVMARYRNALCIAFADGRVADIFDDSVASEPFYLVDTPHPSRTPGFPLDSLSVDIGSGQYYADMQTARLDADLVQVSGYRRFIINTLKAGNDAHEL